MPRYTFAMFDRTQRDLFDDAAPAYDSARPGYPAPLIESLIEHSQLPDRANILEIGCGTGQLTRSLAPYGYTITAVELGGNLAERAAANLAYYTNVRIVHANFETWIPDISSIDLVVSAQAFHWLDPEICLPKIAQLLKPTGTLAVIYNLFPGGEGPLYEAIDRIYQRVYPRSGERASSSLADRVSQTVQAISRGGVFRPPTQWQQRWTMSYTAQRYLRLLETFSDHRALPDETRRRLFQEVQLAIQRHGGIIKRPLVATLFAYNLTG